MAIERASPTAESERLPLGVILTYSAPTAGVGFMFLLVGLYLLKFSTDVLLINPAAMGTIFFVSRVWDAFSDPAAGYLSDRTQTRLGRRRPWLLASALPIALLFLLVWTPPASLTGGALIAWMAMAVIGFYTAMTIFVVPHTSLGAELTPSYHERTRIFGVRHVTWNVGTVLAVGGIWLLGSSDQPRDTALWLALAVAAGTAVVIAWAALRVGERPEFQGRGGTRPWHSFRDVLRNPHARLLLLVFLIENLGAATIGILTPFVGQYIVGTPDQTPLFILTYMVCSAAFVPLWLPLSRRYGKKPLWIFSMLLTGFAFGGMFFLDTGRVLLIYAMAALAGTAASCGSMVGPSIQADVIDWDEHATGERKEGAYFAAWNFVLKGATGVTSLLTGWVLTLSGYVPNAEVQPASAKLWILILYSIFPLVCYTIGAALFRRFSLDEAEHRRLRDALDARASN